MNNLHPTAEQLKPHIESWEHAHHFTEPQKECLAEMVAKFFGVRKVREGVEMQNLTHAHLGVSWNCLEEFPERDRARMMCQPLVHDYVGAILNRMVSREARPSLPPLPREGKLGGGVWGYNLTEEGDVLFGVFLPDKSSVVLMALIWEPFGPVRIPRLRAWNDAWILLPMLAPLFQRLSAEPDITPTKFVELLKEFGFTPSTELKWGGR